jgi:hypothetical protein
MIAAHSLWLLGSLSLTQINTPSRRHEFRRTGTAPHRNPVTLHGKCASFFLFPRYTPAMRHLVDIGAHAEKEVIQ